MTAWQRVLGLVLAGALLAGIVHTLSNRPAGPSPRVSDAYPLQEGLRWTYLAGRNVRGTREIAGWSDQGWILRFDFPTLPANRRELLVRRGDDGILGRLGDTEQLILPLPFKIGTTWTIDFPGWPETASCRVAGWEPVEFLDRKEPAMKVEIVRRDRRTGEETPDAEWYAHGIGLVKMTSTKFGLRVAWTLSKFEDLSTRR